MYLAIEIGGTKLQIVTGDGRGAIHERRKFSVERNAGGAGIRKQIEITLHEILQSSRVEAVGVGFGGPVNWRTGKVWRSHHIEGWSEFDLSAWLGALTGVPVFVDNDANVAALGEAKFGAGRGHDPVFYVTLGSGVGGGLVAGQKIYHGTYPGECEIGHVRLDRQGSIVESQCSGWSVDAKVRAAANAAPEGILATMVRANAPGAEARHLASAIEQRDLAAKRILNEIAGDLGFGLSHATHLFHPAVIIIGGGLSKIGEPLRMAVEAALDGWVMEALSPVPKIALAELGEDVVPVGALRLAHEGLKRN